MKSPFAQCPACETRFYAEFVSGAWRLPERCWSCGDVELVVPDQFDWRGSACGTCGGPMERDDRDDGGLFVVGSAKAHRVGSVDELLFYTGIVAPEKSPWTIECSECGSKFRGREGALVAWLKDHTCEPGLRFCSGCEREHMKTLLRIKRSGVYAGWDRIPTRRT